MELNIHRISLRPQPSNLCLDVYEVLCGIGVFQVKLCLCKDWNYQATHLPAAVQN